jgi:hypothetical protein
LEKFFNQMRRNIMKEQTRSFKIKQICTILLVAGLVTTLFLPFLKNIQPASAFSTSTTATYGPWIEGEPLLNEITDHAVAHCADDPDTFYILGGRGIDSMSAGPSHNFDQFNAETGKWIELPPLPEGLLSSSAVCYEGIIYVVGGEYLGAHNDFYYYNIGTNTNGWTTGPDAPRLVIGAALGTWDGKLYLVGGTFENAAQGYHPVSEVDVYDIATGTWQRNVLPPMRVAVSFPGFAQDGPYLYLVGGFTGDYNHNAKVAQRLDLSTGVWTINKFFGSARAMVAAELTEGHLYAIGGDLNGGDDSNSSTVVEVLDIANWPLAFWRGIGAPLPEPVHGQSTACTDAFIEGVLWSTGGSFFDNDGDPDIYNTNLFYPVEPCINYYFGNLTPEEWISDSASGTPARYVLPLVNDGTQVDTYNISIISQWPAFTPTSKIGPIAPGEKEYVVVDILIPLGPVPVDHNTAVVTITSMGDPSASDSAVLTTYIKTPIGGGDFNPQPITAFWYRTLIPLSLKN